MHVYMMGRLLYVLCKLCSICSILLLERICIGIACYPILLIYQSNIWNEKMHISVTKKRKFDFSAEFYLICSGRVSIYCPIKMTTDSSTMDNLQKVSAQFQLSLKVFDANIAWLAWGIQTNPGNFHHIMDVLKRP